LVGDKRFNEQYLTGSPIAYCTPSRATSVESQNVPKSVPRIVTERKSPTEATTKTVPYLSYSACSVHSPVALEPITDIFPGISPNLNYDSEQSEPFNDLRKDKGYPMLNTVKTDMTGSENDRKPMARVQPANHMEI
jgi:hypothetical protein